MNVRMLALFIALLTACAHADVTVTVDPPGAGGFLKSEVNGKWRVTVRAFYNAGSDVEFFVKGDTTDPIEYVEIGADNVGYSAQVWIDGASLPFDIPSIDEVRIEPQHNAGDVWIE